MRFAKETTLKLKQLHLNCLTGEIVLSIKESVINAINGDDIEIFSQDYPIPYRNTQILEEYPEPYQDLCELVWDIFDDDLPPPLIGELTTP